MKQSFFMLILLAVLLPGSIIAQQQTDKTEQKSALYYKGDMPGKGCYYQGRVIRPARVPDIMRSDPEAYALARNARSNGGLAQVLGYAGGFLIGYPIGTALGGGDPEWVMAGIGAGLLAIGIPLAISSDKKMQRAVEIYNDNLEMQSGSHWRLELASSIDGIGLSLRF